MAAFRILRLNPALNTLSFVKILIAMCRIPENNSAVRLNPALNTLSFVKILIAMCRIPENNSAAFPLLILQSSSVMTPTY
ncbi:hypothetical protein FHA90_13555 [Escherichia coli]|nr:hypothetical protein [Escherichia coli]